MSKEFEISKEVVVLVREATRLKKALSILLVSNRFYAEIDHSWGGKRARKATTQATEILGSELVEQLIKGED